MSKEFNPDEFLETTAPLAEAQADIERRNAEREANGQGPLSGAEAQPNMNPSGPANPVKEPSALENVAANVYGVAKPAIDIGGAVLSNPVVQTGLELAGGGVAAKKFLINPVLDALKPVGQAVSQHVTNATDAMTRSAAAAEASERGIAARAAARAGAVPVTAPAVPTGPVVTAPVAPAPVAQAAEQGLANRVKQTAAQRITGLMPSMGEALGTAGRVLSRFAGPAMLALESRDLGPPVPTSGRMRGMEINPLTRAPWTKAQLAQYEANPDAYDRQLPPPQFRR